MPEWQTRIETLERSVSAFTRRKSSLERQLRLWRGIVGLLVVLGGLLLPVHSGSAQGGQATLAQRVAALERIVAVLQQRVVILDASGSATIPGDLRVRRNLQVAGDATIGGILRVNQIDSSP